MVVSATASALMGNTLLTELYLEGCGINAETTCRGSVWHHHSEGTELEWEHC